MSSEADEVAEVLAAALGISPEAMRRAVAQERARAEQRMRRAAAKRAQGRAVVSEALAESPQQAKVIDELERAGMKRAKAWRNRESGRVAIMLVGEAWHAARGRVGKKLVMVYPDGARVETFERTISVRQTF